jgi:murein DD-endopeptidase MepM/ murein hydrolase activator NlpD
MWPGISFPRAIKQEHRDELKADRTVLGPYILFSLAPIHLAVAARAALADPKPPQVTASFIYPPSPLIQYGTAWLVYEMVITNYIPPSYTLDSIAVSAGARQFSYSGDTLKDMTRLAGAAAQAAHSRTLEGGRTIIVFFALDFTRASDVPTALSHTLHLRSPDGVEHALTVQPLVVQQRAPIVVAPPLRGADWLAGDSMHNGPDAAHRRAILFNDGRAFIAQRYAIDWVRYRLVDGIGTTWSGPEDKNSSYVCYDAPIYSMTPGKVIEVLDGIPENVPHSGKIAIDVNFLNAGGNHVVVDIGYGLYALYAHMRPATLKVKVGDEVNPGYILGHLGNSGNSTEPHLHAHIVDRPSFLAGQGVPYEFDHFEATGATQYVAKPHDRMFFKGIGQPKPFTDDYPAENAIVSFP